MENNTNTCANTCDIPTCKPKEKGACRVYVDDFIVSNRLEFVVRDALLNDGFDLDIVPIDKDGQSYPDCFHITVYGKNNY